MERSLDADARTSPEVTVGSRRGRVLAGLAASFALAGGLAVAANEGTAADHLEAPLVQGDGRTDLNDIYVFQDPHTPGHTALVMTVNPVAGVLSPEDFDPEGDYRFLIDTDGDAKPDERVRISFGEVEEDGRQRVKVKGAAGKAKGWTGEEIALPGGGRLLAGTFDDPFYFDLQAFLDQVKSEGGSRTFCDDDATDFFAGLNVSAIVLEVPSSSITHGSPNIGVWAETRNADGRADRTGKPAIATVLVDDGNEDDFNATKPRRDLEEFGDEVRDNLLALSALDGSGYTPAQAQSVTEILLPDILTVDVSQPGAYLNGRTPADDVIDLSLFVVTGGLFDGSPVLASDCVPANDVPFPTGFPYLAQAHD